MNQGHLPLQQLCEIAVHAARESGQMIRGTDRERLQRHFKEAGSSEASQIVTDVDLRSEAIIRKSLQAASERWDIAFLGEESSQDLDGGSSERLLKPQHWCVDPLDGTLPFMEGRPGYAVSIALVDNSGVPLIGVIYDPIESVVTHAIKGLGVYRDGTPMTGEVLRSSSLVVFADASFSEHEKYAEVLDVLNACAQQSALNGVEVVYGSGAVKNASQVLGYSEACYLKLPKPEDGGGSTWDFAATACIASEAGAWVSDIHGRPLALNRRGSTFMNKDGVLYASNERIGRYLIDANIIDAE